MVPANSSALMSGVFTELQTADLVAMHLVRAVRDADGARVRVGAGELEILAEAGRAVCLNGPVEHLAGGVGRRDPDAGDLGARRLVAHGIHEPSGLVDQ